MHRSLEARGRGGSLVLPLTRSEAREAKAIRGAHGRETHVVGSTAHGDQRGEGGAGHGGHGGGVAHRGRGGGGGLGARGGGEKEAPFAEVMVVEVNKLEEVAGLETEVQVVTPIMPPNLVDRVLPRLPEMVVALLRTDFCLPFFAFFFPCIALLTSMSSAQPIDAMRFILRFLFFRVKWVTLLQNLRYGTSYSVREKGTAGIVLLSIIDSHSIRACTLLQLLMHVS